MSKKTILSVWDADGGGPYIVCRELTDYNITYPESLLIFETKVSEGPNGLIIEPVGIDEIDSVLSADDFDDIDDGYYVYIALVNGLTYSGESLGEVYDRLLDDYDFGIVRRSKIKPYEWPKTEAEGN